MDGSPTIRLKCTRSPDGTPTFTVGHPDTFADPDADDVVVALLDNCSNVAILPLSMAHHALDPDMCGRPPLTTVSGDMAAAGCASIILAAFIPSAQPGPPRPAEARLPHRPPPPPS